MKVWHIRFYIAVCVIVILASAWTVASQKEKETFQTSYIQLPLHIHILRNMKMTHTYKDRSQKTETEMDSWLTKDEAKELLEKVNATFFRKNGIEWTYADGDITESELKDDTYLKELSKIKRLHPNSSSEDLKKDARKRDGMYRKIASNTDIPLTPKTTNLCFFTFTGNTRQGKKIDNGDTPLVVIGQWSNKQNRSIPTKRTLIAEAGNPSLLFTVAHELAHVLGLVHLGTEENNIMNTQTNSFDINLDQEIIMRRMAKRLTKNKNYSTSLKNDYHASEDLIRENEKHKMNVFYVRGEDGKPVGINMERTQTFPTFYTPGSYTYSARNYVPAYEDAVKLANVDISRKYGYEYDLVRNSGGYSFVRDKKENNVQNIVYDNADMSSYRD